VPTITLRLDDQTRDALQQKAEEEGLTVSDFVRVLIREAVVDRSAAGAAPDGYAPDTLSPKDRHLFSLLHRILARVLPEDNAGMDGSSEDQLERAQVLEEGLTLEYAQEFTGIDEELTKRDSIRVMDILDMFRTAKYSLERIASEGTPVAPEIAERLQYMGFDHNDPLEAKMAGYVLFLVDHDRWEEQRDFVHGRTGGNSHMPVLDMYLRMLAEYRRITAGRRLPGSRGLLNAEELRAVADAAVHPANRGEHR
jgi:uncharacterized protein YfbU (UPF0304 family)